MQLEKLKNFYQKWYRPDLMAFVVVGDIDINYAENKIKQHFSKLNKNENATIRPDYEIPDHQETFVTIAQDRENPYSIVYIYNKLNNIGNIQTLESYRKSILNSLIVNMINQRFEELMSKPNPPFIQAFSDYTPYFITKNKSAFILGALTPDTGLLSGLKALLIENRRVYLHGFTESELERSKKIILKSYEKAFNEKDKTESSTFASEYIRNFLYNEPIPGIEFEYNYVKKIIPDITLYEINNVAKNLLKPNSRVIVIQAPEKDNIILPDSNTVLSIVKSFDELVPESYSENLLKEDLLDNLKEKGKIISKKINKLYGIIELKLSNNVKVVLYPTNYKNDEILFNAISLGENLYYQIHYLFQQNLLKI